MTLNKYRTEFRISDHRANNMSRDDHQALIASVARDISDHAQVKKAAGFRLPGGVKSVVITFLTPTDTAASHLVSLASTSLSHVYSSDYSTHRLNADGSFNRIAI